MDNRRSASTTKTQMKLYNSAPLAVEPKENQHIAPFGHTPYIKIKMKLMKSLISSLWHNKNKGMGINRNASTTKTQMELYNSAFSLWNQNKTNILQPLDMRLIKNQIEVNENHNFKPLAQ